eukprot:jgi/Bigna1/74013/fgenesh1_pg.27_\
MHVGGVLWFEYSLSEKHRTKSSQEANPMLLLSAFLFRSSNVNSVNTPFAQYYNICSRTKERMTQNSACIVEVTANDAEMEYGPKLKGGFLLSAEEAMDPDDFMFHSAPITFVATQTDGPSAHHSMFSAHALTWILRSLLKRSEMGCGWNGCKEHKFTLKVIRVFHGTDVHRVVHVFIWYTCATYWYMYVSNVHVGRHAHIALEAIRKPK